MKYGETSWSGSVQISGGRGKSREMCGLIYAPYLPGSRPIQGTYMSAQSLSPHQALDKVVQEEALTPFSPEVRRRRASRRLAHS